MINDEYHKIINLIRKRNGEIIFFDTIKFYLKNFKDNNNYYKNLMKNKIILIDYYNNQIHDLCIENDFSDENNFLLNFKTFVTQIE